MWLQVVTLTCLSFTLKSSSAQECALAESERVDCGYYGIDAEECATRGCCWQTCEGCDSDIPWCFLSGDMLEPACLIDTQDKVDCGYVGINHSECLQRGCCWAPSSLSNEPWCFEGNEPVTQGPQYEEGTIHLADGGDPMQGRVTIYHAGEWGTVCDDGWDDKDARVVCRQLGYPYGQGFREAYYGSGEGPILMDEVYCTGEESSLIDCPFKGWGNNDCSHAEDAAVVCDYEERVSTEPPTTTSTEEPATTQGPQYEEGTIYLADGGDPMQGRVTIYHAGEWGTVCDDGWDDNDARVVCRQLGYPYGQGFGEAYYGSGEGPILMDQVHCRGSESSLIDCTFGGWGNHDCSHAEDAAVVCDYVPSTSSP